jgi:hypothetical protein
MIFPNLFKSQPQKLQRKKKTLGGRLFPWLLLRLKPTTENKCLVTDEKWIHVHGPQQFLR